MSEQPFDYSVVADNSTGNRYFLHTGNGYADNSPGHIFELSTIEGRTRGHSRLFKEMAVAYLRHAGYIVITPEERQAFQQLAELRPPKESAK